MAERSASYKLLKGHIMITIEDNGSRQILCKYSDITSLSYVHSQSSARRRPSAVQCCQAARQAALDAVDLHTWWPAERFVSRALIHTARTLASHDQTCMQATQTQRNTQHEYSPLARPITLPSSTCITTHFIPHYVFIFVQRNDMEHGYWTQPSHNGECKVKQRGLMLRIIQRTKNLMVRINQTLLSNRDHHKHRAYVIQTIKLANFCWCGLIDWSN